MEMKLIEALLKTYQSFLFCFKASHANKFFSFSKKKKEANSFRNRNITFDTQAINKNCCVGKCKQVLQTRAKLCKGVEHVAGKCLRKFSDGTLNRF